MQTSIIKSLKKIGVIVAAAIGISSYQPAQAATLFTTGRVLNVSVNDLTTQGANTNSFTLVGMASLGNCTALWGYVVFLMKDDSHGQQMYAAALAAAASGSAVSVAVDDTYRDSRGYCYATAVGFTGN